MSEQLLVTQLKFARSEFLRCLDGVTEADALRHFEPLNCISWTVGHMANQEHTYWVLVAQGKNLAPTLRDLVGFGRPASYPPFDEMWKTWREVTSAADNFLSTLDPPKLETYFQRNGKPVDESIGTLLMRNIYHYWYHIGQVHAVRELIGHTNLPDFVGAMTSAAYRVES